MARRNRPKPADRAKRAAARAPLEAQARQAERDRLVTGRGGECCRASSGGKLEASGASERDESGFRIVVPGELRLALGGGNFAHMRGDRAAYEQDTRSRRTS